MTFPNRRLPCRPPESTGRGADRRDLDRPRTDHGRRLGQAAERPDIVPLPDHLESIRAAEATELYGSPDILPLESRKSSLISMGDSQISGEGVGNYDPDTHTDGNWCDRSYDQALFHTGIESDVEYNISCSGAASQHLIEGSGQQQWNELNQGDHLAIKARNTDVDLVWIIVGANDEGASSSAPPPPSARPTASSSWDRAGPTTPRTGRPESR
ncbi:hypothetical protein GCM10029992_42460 [Glycomyces albus]